METLINLAVILVAAVLTWRMVAAVYWIVRCWRDRKPRRMVECAACHKPLPVAKAVIVHGRITRDRDAYATTVAEYCKAHAPGSPRSLP